MRSLKYLLENHKARVDSYHYYARETWILNSCEEERLVTNFKILMDNMDKDFKEQGYESEFI